MAAGDNKYGVPSWSKEYRKRYQEENKERLKEYGRRYQKRKREEADIARGFRLRRGRPMKPLPGEVDSLAPQHEALPFAESTKRVDDGSPTGASPLVDEADAYPPFVLEAAAAEGVTPEEWIAARDRNARILDGRGASPEKPGDEE